MRLPTREFADEDAAHGGPRRRLTRGKPHGPQRNAPAGESGNCWRPVRSHRPDWFGRARFAAAHALPARLAPWPGMLAYRIRRRLAEWIAPRPEGPTLIPTRHGFQLVVDPTTDTGVESSLYYLGTYETATLHMLRQCLRAGDIVLDAGANIGLMSLVASAVVGPTGRVYAFEPFPPSCRLLRLNVRLNHRRNVRVFPLALGARRDRGRIYPRSNRNRGSASLVRQQDSVGPGEEIVIRALDQIVEELAVERVRLLKIDVEGWELEVLHGARATLAQEHAPILCVEHSLGHPLAGGRPAEIPRLLARINEYRAFRLAKGKDRPSRLVPVRDEADLPRHDNLFFFLPAHLDSLDPRLFAGLPSALGGAP